MITLCLDTTNFTESKELAEAAGAINCKLIDDLDNVDQIKLAVRDKAHAFEVIDAIYGNEDDRDSNEEIFEMVLCN